MNKKYSDFLMKYDHKQMSGDYIENRGPLMEALASLAKWWRKRTTCWLHYREIKSLNDHIAMRRKMYDDLLERYEWLSEAFGRITGKPVPPKANK